MLSDPIIVFRSRARGVCNEHALVLQAAAIPFRAGSTAGEYVLAVSAADEARALAEFAAYAEENRGWQPRDPLPAVPTAGSGWAGVTGYVMVLCGVSMLADNRVFGADWRAAGKTAAELVRGGDWWRVITALTLHADLQHLAANLTFGGIFGFFAGRMLGSGLAWISILATGALGNLVNAWIQPLDHSAVGASTAVFGCLGLLSAYGWRVRQRTAGGWTRVWIPLIGGSILLGFLGTGGERTDVMAHVTGFGSGLVLGAVYGEVGHKMVPQLRGQLGLGCVAVAAVVAAWALALR